MIELPCAHGEASKQAVKEGEGGGGDSGIWENMKITFNMKRQRQRVKYFFTFPRCHQIGPADSRVKPSSRDRKRDGRPARRTDRRDWQTEQQSEKTGVLFYFALCLYILFCVYIKVK